MNDATRKINVFKMSVNGGWVLCRIPYEEFIIDDADAHVRTRNRAKIKEARERW